MGKYLNRVKTRFGGDTRGMLEGGRYALLHTRTLEFDELRPYVPGDDVRDIDWKASARSGSVLIKRFVSEKHHKILLVADTGRNMTAPAPSGERKSDVALHILGAVGLITLGRSDEIGMVYGDAGGSARVRQRRGENHIESLLHCYRNHVATSRGSSDIACQLTYVAEHYRHRMLVVVVSDEPDADARLEAALTRVTGRHDVMWAIVADMPAVAIGGDGGYDVATGRSVLGAAAREPRVVAAYRRAEKERARRLAELMASRAIPHVTLSGTDGLRRGIVEMTGVWSRAG
ncbi:hypothetical protein Mycch_0649 [Mycolicibacterium chubuense NBB4]|uniref:DUF58 domain-containing protein n=1 Tax=Mycolicibacterium chubuense (strain NBB4) TaxID=710421 RepID=I4BDW0_MYCCN|nr:DUF58 domain-containing protein [Mycolicibacterium chubuense]AFM15467.1 hypothetical protein Mycch_0649 [Mycolicibacterium chubuense NBB4]